MSKVKAVPSILAGAEKTAPVEVVHPLSPNAMVEMTPKFKEAESKNST